MSTEDRLLVQYLETHPEDAARCLERFPSEDIRAALERVPPGAAAQALTSLPPALAARVLSLMPGASVSPLIAKMPDQQAAGLLRRLEEEERAALLANLPTLRRERLQRLIRCRENTVGALMSLDAVVLFADSTAEYAREVAKQYGGTGTAHVLARTQRPVGVISHGQLAGVPGHAAVQSLARPVPAVLSVNTECSIAASHPCWREADEVPVVSNEGMFAGVLQHRSLRAWAPEAPSGGGGGLDTALGLSELAWLGMKGVMDVLLAPPGREGRHD